MIMGAATRKFVLVVHITSSLGLLGAVVSFLALAIVGLISADPDTARASYVSMDAIAWFVILPLAVVTLLIGLIQSLGTAWGVFRHYWVLAKLVVAIFVILILSLQMGMISEVAEAARQGLLAPTLFEARLSMVVHAGGGLLVLLIPAALSVYKPRGKTRYGRRMEHAG